jgi:hypothetical protein
MSTDHATASRRRFLTALVAVGAAGVPLRPDDREIGTPAARTRADEIAAAFDDWQSKRPRKPRGYRKAERAQLAAQKRQARLADKIFATPARTPAGLTAKARVAIVEMSPSAGEPDADIGISLARDVIALAANVAA